MNQPENKTIINDTISFLDSRIGPAATQTQLTQTIMQGIQEGRRNFKPYAPKQLCQYPNPAKLDDFNFNEGLGTVSFQPILDGLNNFKQNAINEIKTKFQAMGPENSKDIKLASGAIDMIQSVYQAAKCFTQVVTNINNLISSYINAININIVNVINTINTLENQINEFRTSFLTTTNINYLIAICGENAVLGLTQTTNIFDMLGAIVELQNALADADRAATVLLDSNKRIRRQMTISLTLLQNRISSFIYYQSIKGSLQNSLISANSMILQDDYLNDFTYSNTIQESSFNWSLTNSGGISDCNIDDDLSVIPKLNNMMKNYSGTNNNTITIASRTEEGTIVVSENTDGLISVGIDPRLGTDVNLIFDLSINNGETIIRAIARGDSLGPNDIVTTKAIGRYYNYGKESFDYNILITNGDGTFDLYVTDLTKISDIVIGSIYYFNNPITQKPLSFSWDKGTTKNYFPVLFKVINTTNRVVTVKILGNSDLYVSDFIPGAASIDYTFNNTVIAPPGSQQGNIKIDILTGNILVEPVTADPSTYLELNSITLNKYNLTSLINKIPHSGEKIICHNWSLMVTPFGNMQKIRNAHFSGQFPGETISLFFLKAKWGFIPSQS